MQTGKCFLCNKRGTLIVQDIMYTYFDEVEIPPVILRIYLCDYHLTKENCKLGNKGLEQFISIEYKTDQEMMYEMHAEKR